MFADGIAQYRGPMTRGTARLIGLAIRQAAWRAGVAVSPPRRSELAELRRALPQAAPAIDALERARPGDDPVDVLRRVLPFNVR
ncbi:MAG: hypothetical protein KGS47_01500 [Chloroflexi bacterium]|nr:hypothetical protein [Chloroflexota bacterium]